MTDYIFWGLFFEFIALCAAAFGLYVLLGAIESRIKAKRR